MPGLNVLALVTDAFGGYGGIAQYNRDFITALGSCDGIDRIDVLPRLAPDKLSKIPPKVFQQSPRSGRLQYSANAVAQAIASKPHIVFCGHLFHGPLALGIARLTGAHLVSQLHGTEVWKPLRGRDLHPLLASKVVLAVSRDTFARLRDQANFQPSACRVLANTVQSDFMPGDRTTARSRFGLDLQTVILSVARLDQREGYKGHDRIISALPSLRSNGRDVVYLIAGIGDDKPRLEAVARATGVADHVWFLGKVPYEALPDLYRAADIFALPSTGEGFGIVYLEAMACGTPAIGLSVGGSPDALGDGDLGWCVPPEQFPQALAKALDSPRPDPDQLHRAVTARFGEQAFRSRVADLVRTIQ